MSAPTQLEDDTFTGKIDFSMWKRIFAFAAPYHRQMALLITLGILVATFDVGITLFNKLLIDAVKDGATRSQLLRDFLLYAAMMGAFAASIWGFIMTAGRISTGFAYDLRNAGFQHLQQLSFSFYDKRAVGWLMARMTGDVGTLARTLSWAQLDLAWGLTVLPLVGGTMLYLNWKLGLLVLVTWPAILFTARYFQSHMLLVNRKLRKAGSQTTAAYNEGLQGVRTTKSMGREEKNLAEFSQLSGAMYDLALRNTVYNALMMPILSSLCFIGVALALWRGGYDVQATAHSFGFTVGSLFAFIQLATFIQFPVEQLARTITNVQGAQVSLERLQTFLDTKPEIADGPDLLPSNDLPKRIETITFENVSFGYLPGQTVLSDFSLSVQPGQSIALVGPTGGGKSTIVSLACRFYEPTTGRILINGIDYRRLPLAWLQSRLGMVLQQPHLFSGTILENIRYGKLDATDAEVEHAARLAGAHEFIHAFPDKYTTKVGEGGNRLSTGQKQLIALARAIIADPQIFVMDEATSSVDTQTERAIQTAVDRVLAGRISFVIAHRLSTIKRADIILVIAGGRVIEQGNHHDLLALRGKYFELYTNQFTQEHENELLHAGAPQPAPATA